MAIANSDGSIILSTKVDTSGINKGMSQMQRKAAGLTKTFSKLGAAIASAFAIQKIIQFSNEAGQLSTQTEASVQRLVDIYGEASDSVGDFIDANARALGMSKAAAASFSSVYGNLFSVWADQATNAELTNRYLNMTAVVASKTGRTVEDVQERVRSGLLGNAEAIEDLGIFVNVKTIEMTDAFKRMANGKSWEQLDAYTQQQIRSMAILEQATAKYGDEVADTSATIRNRFNAAYQDFKNSWGNIVNTVLLPVLETLTQIFDIATKGLNALSGGSGQILENVELQKESTGKTAENIEEQTKNQKELNKELKKSLAGFDDIQILSNQIAETGQSSTAELTLPTIGGDVASQTNGDTGSKFDEITEKIKTTLDVILDAAWKSLLAVGLIVLFLGNVPLGLGLIGTAMLSKVGGDALGSENPLESIKASLDTLKSYIIPAMLAIGVLLLFSGMIPIGIGLILAGAIYLGYKEVQSEAYDVASLNDKINSVMEIVSLALIAIGVILLFVGVVPLGIGFIVGGAVSLGVTEEKLEEGGITTKVQQFFKDNEDLIYDVAMALVVLGVILFVTGVGIPLGLGLLVAGGTILANSESEKKGTFNQKIQNFIDENGVLIIGVSIAMLVLGIILLLSGVGLPLGLGLLVAGGVILAKSQQEDLNVVKNKINQFFRENEGLIKGISIVLVILGVILLFTGVGIALGIGLLIAGGAALAAPANFDWGSLLQNLKDVWNSIVEWWNQYIAPVFTAEWWANLGKQSINGLIEGFEGGINGIIGAFESMINWIVDGLNSISFDIPDWLGGGTFGINIPNVSFGRVSIPRLAQGSVIPPNKEFMAILGDNTKEHEIVSPLSTMKQAFTEAMIEMGGTGQTVKEEHYYLSETELMTILHKLVKGGERLQGPSLISGGVR